MLKLLAKFHATTAFWLVQVYLNDVKIGENAENDYIPKECKEVTFPLPETVPDTLRYLLFKYFVFFSTILITWQLIFNNFNFILLYRCIPEFVVENTIRFLYLLRRLNPNVFEEQGPSFLTPVLTEVS